jgi:SPP1 gp7 family putative phage head morphogenesis protein
LKTLTPLRLRPAYWRDTEAQVIDILRDLLFRPLVKIMRQADQDIKAKGLLDTQQALAMSNATREDKLIEAMRAGRVQYSGGVFSGEFSAAISTALKNMGATFDQRSRVFKIDQAKVPSWIKAEGAMYRTRAHEVNQLLKRKLDEIQKNIIHDINIRSVDAQKTIDALQAGFKPVAKKLEVQPELDARSREQMASEYSDNLKLYIQKFADDEILSLRETVEENAREGYRFDKLIPKIKQRYGISVRKAKFLARNETSIFMSKYHEKRYQEAGIDSYIWSTSHDARVRPALGTHGSDNHRVLDGRTFSFSNPPIVDPAVGRKANPGQDYNCRCVAIPILGDKTAARREYREQLEMVTA